MLPQGIPTGFVDDITISSHFDLKPYTSLFIKVITDESFRISHQKTNYKGVTDITGISVRNNSIQPDKKFIDKLNDPNQTDKQKAGRLIYLNRVLEANS
jgi:hypothetical protein